MELEIQDPQGNVITTIEIFDDVFHRMELRAAERGISVQDYILSIIREYAQRILDNEQDEA